MQSVLAFFMSIIMFLMPTVNYPHREIDKSDWTTDYTYVFVHGLDGWGEYEFYYKLFPYWGVFGGDLMTYLRARGIDAHGASVNGDCRRGAPELHGRVHARHGLPGRTRRAPVGFGICPARAWVRAVR